MRSARVRLVPCLKFPGEGGNPERSRSDMSSTIVRSAKIEWPRLLDRFDGRKPSWLPHGMLAHPGQGQFEYTADDFLPLTNRGRRNGGQTAVANHPLGAYQREHNRNDHEIREHVSEKWRHQ